MGKHRLYGYSKETDCPAGYAGHDGKSTEFKMFLSARETGIDLSGFNLPRIA